MAVKKMKKKRVPKVAPTPTVETARSLLFRGATTMDIMKLNIPEINSGKKVKTMRIELGL